MAIETQTIRCFHCGKEATIGVLKGAVDAFAMPSGWLLSLDCGELLAYYCSLECTPWGQGAEKRWAARAEGGATREELDERRATGPRER